MNNNLNANFITGFTNANGSFMISISRVNTLKYKYRVTPLFVLTQMDRDLLDLINSYFDNKGHIILDKRSKCYYLRFNSIKNIVNYIIPHFDKYPLKGKKLFDYEKFKYIVESMDKDKIHLSEMGIAQIAKLSLYTKNESKLKKHIIMNLSNKLKKPIKDLPFKSKLIIDNTIDPWYLTGMIQGDGSLYVILPRECTNFALGQEVESLDILTNIKIYFKNIGHIYKINDNYYRYMIYKKKDIMEVLIPHLKKYPLYSKKGLDFSKMISFTEGSCSKSEIYYLMVKEEEEKV